MQAMESWRYHEFCFSQARARAELLAGFFRNAYVSAIIYQPTYILKS